MIIIDLLSASQLDTSGSIVEPKRKILFGYLSLSSSSALLMSPLLGHKPPLWIKNKENGS
jgi:hypothetical protein